MEPEIGMMLLQAKECLEPSEARRDRKKTPPRAVGGERGPVSVLSRPLKSEVLISDLGSTGL